MRITGVSVIKTDIWSGQVNIELGHGIDDLKEYMTLQSLYKIFPTANGFP